MFSCGNSGETISAKNLAKLLSNAKYDGYVVTKTEFGYVVSGDDIAPIEYYQIH